MAGNVPVSILLSNVKSLFEVLNLDYQGQQQFGVEWGGAILEPSFQALIKACDDVDDQVNIINIMTYK